MDAITEYCLGFAFDPTLSRVVLIQKNRPAFLAGRWTGVGGHVEEGETPAEAISREFQEEANVATSANDWVHLGEFGRDSGERLDVFAAVMDLSMVRSCTEELVQVFDVSQLPPPDVHGRLLVEFITQARALLASVPVSARDSSVDPSSSPRAPRRCP